MIKLCDGENRLKAGGGHGSLTEGKGEPTPETEPIMGSDFDKLNNVVCFNDESIKSKELFNLSKSDPINLACFRNHQSDHS